jgi:predicted nuclease of restriction endonuclease-like (RecB) superfamily
MSNQTSLFSDSHHDYAAFLNGLKNRIRTAQVRASLAVNQELIRLYWQIGNEILTRQKQEGWGAKVIERLAKDLKREFPDMTGFSQTNLKYMRSFAEAYSEVEISQRCVDQLPWRHNITLLVKVKEREARFWYAQKALENGWSRDVLALQVDSNLLERQGGAITNFERSLPAPQSDLAQQLIKDPYNFDFLSLTEAVQERELERGLVDHIRDFLLELGMGFSFLGSQYPIVVSGKEYRIDLLFYHVVLHSYVVIELKIGEFEPQHSGQMSFYVAAVDNQLRTERDDPTIGIILCRSKDKTTVEYALQGTSQPIGVATYQLQSQLPESLKASLPSVEQFEIELTAAIEEIEDSERPEGDALDE